MEKRKCSLIAATGNLVNYYTIGYDNTSTGRRSYVNIEMIRKNPELYENQKEAIWQALDLKKDLYFSKGFGYCQQ